MGGGSGEFGSLFLRPRLKELPGDFGSLPLRPRLNELPGDFVVRLKESSGDAGSLRRLYSGECHVSLASSLKLQRVRSSAAAACGGASTSSSRSMAKALRAGFAQNSSARRQT